MDDLIFSGNRFAAKLFDLERVRRLASQRITLGTSWSEVVWRILNVGVWGARFDVDV